MKDQAKALHALQIIKRDVHAARLGAARAARRQREDEAAAAASNHEGIRSLLVGAIREGAHRDTVRRMEDTRERCAVRLGEAQDAVEDAARAEAQAAAAAVAVEKRIEGLTHVLGEFALQALFAEEEEQ